MLRHVCACTTWVKCTGRQPLPHGSGAYTTYMHHIHAALPWLHKLTCASYFGNAQESTIHHRLNIGLLTCVRPAHKGKANDNTASQQGQQQCSMCVCLIHDLKLGSAFCVHARHDSKLGIRLNTRPAVWMRRRSSNAEQIWRGRCAGIASRGLKVCCLGEYTYFLLNS